MTDIKTAKANETNLKSNVKKFKDKINSTLEEAGTALLELYEKKYY